MRQSGTETSFIKYFYIVIDMKLLVVADIHGDHEKLSRILEKEKGKFDAVVAPGDFTDMYEIPEGFDQLEIAEIIVLRLVSTRKPVFAVPGNHDPYHILEIFKDYSINLHNNVKTYEGIDFMGWGGALTPFDTKFEPTEEETEEYLEKMHKSVKRKRFVLIAHSPPYNTKLDMTIEKIHVGSKALLKFIKEKKPMLVISAHIHESGNMDTVGNTKIFYPGPVFEGRYGIVEIGQKKVECIMKKI